MERPKIEDFKTEYKHGFAESSSIIKQYSKAQDLYINYLEQLELTAVVQVCDNCKTPTIKGNLCHPCKVDPDLSNE
jgi:hypothetical protein